MDSAWLKHFHPLHHQVGTPPDPDSYIARAMQTFEVSGLSLAIVKDGTVVVAKGYGVKKMGEPALVDENRLFGIGSNTKAFTSALLALLVDERKHSWDDKVYELLPGSQMYDLYVSHEITIRDLLTHKSGMGWARAICCSGHTAPTRVRKSLTGQIAAAITGKSREENVRDVS